MGAYGSKPSGKAKPSQYPFGPATGGTEMISSNKTKMSGKQMKEWEKVKGKKK